MKFEHLKTFMLTALVGLSIVLTWQLWNIQPDMGMLDDDVSSIPQNTTIGEERILKNVIRPEELIVHHGEEMAMVPPNDQRFNQFYEALLQTNLYEFDLLAQGPFPKELDEEQSGVELIFPTAVPIEVFFNLFQLDEEVFNLPLTSVNRMFMYSDGEDELLHLQIYSVVDERVIELSTTFSTHDFERMLVTPFEEFITVVPANGQEHLSLKQRVYVTEEPMTVDKLSYTTIPISVDFF